MSKVGIFLIAVALIAGMVGCDGDGNGNGPDPYADYIKIYDWTDLDNIRDNLAAKYVLMNNLDSSTVGYDEVASAASNSGKGWQPIGYAEWDGIRWHGPMFTGIFDGQGYVISDLAINRSDENVVALFGAVDTGGVIEDVGIVESDISGNEYVGGLVAVNCGKVLNSYSVVNVSGEHHFGNLIGANESGHTVSNSYYNYDEGLINEQQVITIGALYDEYFEIWLANNKSWSIDETLSQEDGYYLINNEEEFKYLLIFGQNASLKFRLASDLDFIDEPDFFIPYLTGEFDGNGHKVSNLKISSYNISQIGLFGFLACGAKVTGLGVDNVDITGYDNVGGLVGTNIGSVDNCYSTGGVTGFSNTGGLIGRTFWEYGYPDEFGTVSNSYSTARVTGNRTIGGLVGENCGSVSKSYSTGSVTGLFDVGGLVGWNFWWPVVDSYASGNVTGVGSVGGLVGGNQGTVSNSCATGEVTGYSDVGGLVGWNNGDGSVSDSCSAASVTGNFYVGGLVGQSAGNISNSYSTGSVAGEWGVGGMIGNMYDGMLRDSYSTGSVTGDSDVGGLIGCDDVGGYSEGTVTNSFWDTETSGQSTSDGGTDKNTAEMKDITTFSAATWNIIAVDNSDLRNTYYNWNIVDDETYPFLSWEPVS